MRKPSFIFEVIGPAGAGKTTVTRAILQKGLEVREEFPPAIKSVRNSPFFALNTIRLVPVLLRLGPKDKTFRSLDAFLILNLLQGWGERLQTHAARLQAHLARLETHAARLQAHPARLETQHEKGKAVILDQGPVFMFSFLKIYGSPAIFSGKYKAWRESLYQKWANALDLIVWLDASDTVLIERVKARAVRHGIKENSEQWALDFYKSYRDSYTEVISKLKQYNPDLAVLRFNTGECSVDDICGHIGSYLMKNGNNEKTL